MDSIGKLFREWVLTQRPQGTAPVYEGRDRICVDVGNAVAEIAFYPYQDGLEIAEYQITRSLDGKVTFYLHVLLDDLSRAEELFAEMVEALGDAVSRTTTRVILCCTSALTTSLFAAKMNEMAEALALDYDFCAMPVDRALAEKDDFEAVLLAPQASHMRHQMMAAHPDSVVFEIPGRIYGAYDAAGAIRLLMHALRDADLLTSTHSGKGVRVVRDLSNDKRILIITLFVMSSYVRLGYRLYDHGRPTVEGFVRKQSLDYRDIEDLLGALGARGIPVGDLDFIGIAVPGVAYHGNISLPGTVKGDYNLGAHIEKRFGIKTSIDNNCNAAAVGCYIGQDRYENVMFYRHEFGHIAGGLGTVIDGTLLKGRHNLAGEPKYYESLFAYDPSYEEMLLSEDGMLEIARNVALAGIALIAPEALYLSVDTVDDMDKFRQALMSGTVEPSDRCRLVGPMGGELLVLPEELVPDLYVVDDYVERVYLGEMALCLQKLRNPNYRSLGIA